ncbi:MAG: hypothetical protein ABL908_06015, partial [Hyphomicrobium sp.]
MRKTPHKHQRLVAAHAKDLGTLHEAPTGFTEAGILVVGPNSVAPVFRPHAPIADCAGQVNSRLPLK